MANGDLRGIRVGGRVAKQRRRAYFWKHSFERQLVPAKHLASSVLIEAVGNFIACLERAAIEQSEVLSDRCQHCPLYSCNAFMRSTYHAMQR